MPDTQPRALSARSSDSGAILAPYRLREFGDVSGHSIGSNSGQVITDTLNARLRRARPQVGEDSIGHVEGTLTVNETTENGWQ